MLIPDDCLSSYNFIEHSTIFWCNLNLKWFGFWEEIEEKWRKKRKKEKWRNLWRISTKLLENSWSISCHKWQRNMLIAPWHKGIATQCESCPHIMAQHKDVVARSNPNSNMLKDGLIVFDRVEHSCIWQWKKILELQNEGFSSFKYQFFS